MISLYILQSFKVQILQKEVFPKVRILRNEAQILQNEVRIQNVVQIRKVQKVVFSFPSFPFPKGMVVFHKVLLPNLLHKDILLRMEV